MADETNIKINLVTAGDPKGAQQVEKAIDEVKDASREASAAATAQAQANDRLDGAQQRAAGSSRNMGNALLQGSRALQDMQYGLAGVVNNLEGIASALGLGAGVAGVVTVLAVAVQTLGPKVVDWFASLDKEGAKAKAVKTTFEEFANQLRADFDPAQDASKNASKAFADQLDKERQSIDDARTALDLYISNLRLKNQIQDTADQAIERRRIEDIRAMNLPPEEQARREAMVRQATLDARKAREDQEAAAAEAAARDQVELARAQAASTQQGVDAAQRNVRDSITVAALSEPKNKGSLPGLIDQLTEARAEYARLEAEFGASAAQTIQGARINELEAVLKQRRTFIDEVVNRTGGATIGELEAQRDKLQEQAKKDQEAISKASQEAARVAQENTIRAVGRENVYQTESAAIARQYATSAAPGGAVFNEPAAALEYMSRTGQAAITPQSTGAIKSPLGQFARTPLEGGFSGGFSGGLGAPLGQVTAPIEKAAQTLQGSPLDLSELGRPLEELGTAVTGLRDNLQEQIKQLGQKVGTVEQQLRNSTR